ncbi:MAG: hypothetical protein JNL01_07235 [Bdellovibrionales bacterium]|nr:hypothetical protein [Bdellovibrionales bacterium]
MMMKSALTLGVLFYAIVPSSIWASSDQEWVEVAKSDVVTVYRKEIPGSSVYAYRGEAKIAAPLEIVLSIVFDTERRTEWAERVRYAKLIKKTSPFEKWEHFITRVPWPLKDRDFVTHTTITPNKEKKTVTLFVESVTLPDYPENPDLVRGDIKFAKFEMKSIDGGKGTEILAESHADPKGNIPAFIVNIIQKTFPQKTITNILKQASKPDIVPHPVVAQYGLKDGPSSATPVAAQPPKEQKEAEVRKQ